MVFYIRIFIHYKWEDCLIDIEIEIRVMCILKTLFFFVGLYEIIINGSLCHRILVIVLIMKYFFFCCFLCFFREQKIVEIY